MIHDLERLLQHHPQATVAVACHDCQTGAETLIRPHENFHPASTIKIGVMMAVYHQAEQGLLRLDDRLPILNEFTSIADSQPFSLTVEYDSETSLYGRIGETESLRELVRLMITQSSNFATNLLLQCVTAESVTALMRDLGALDILVLRGPEDNRAFALGLNNVASAYGLMHLLRLLAEGEVVSPAASRAMIAVLLGQAFNEGIPAGLPDGVPVAHKTGWNTLLYHDAAIVFPPGRKPYILVVLTQGLPEDGEAPALVAAVSRRCYQGLLAS